MFEKIRCQVSSYYANLQKAALVHPDPMMRIESKAELAILRIVLYLFILTIVYFGMGILFGIYLCQVEKKCL
jgi:hypothetical protein